MRKVITAIMLSAALNVYGQDSKIEFKDIYAPVIVGVPPSDAYIGLSRMEDGEIRHYNYGERGEKLEPIYLSSRDNGLTWKEMSLPMGIPYADTRSPLSGEYIRAMMLNRKVFIIRTEGGINGGRTITKIDDNMAIMLKPPVFFDNGTKVIIGGHGGDGLGCFSYMSEDDGRTWIKSNRVNSPKHEKGGEHKGVRWNHGAVEPTITELKDGRLWMVMRTALDNHYQSFSSDGGLTWSEPEPSPFYATITMPTFYKLSDGRLLFFWSNTTPLPEMESATGQWDDVFTNRNATHVAISEDDGETWIGMRELLLDLRRDADDFATAPGADKSVHQAQAVELEDGKVLAAVGQNKLHRKMVIFDVDWLYETYRENDFSNGLEDWSTFRYYKGIVGHCGYNRQKAELLVEHPDKSDKSVLKIGYMPNDTLVEDRDGAVWNFPVLKDGVATIKLKAEKGSEGINLILNDRWFNPTDTVALAKGQYVADLSRKALKISDDKWHEVKIEWSEGKSAVLYVDGKKRQTLPIVSPSIHGPSYLHFLSGDKPDSIGVLIESVKVEKKK